MKSLTVNVCPSHPSLSVILDRRRRRPEKGAAKGYLLGLKAGQGIGLLRVSQVKVSFPVGNGKQSLHHQSAQLPVYGIT